MGSSCNTRERYEKLKQIFVVKPGGKRPLGNAKICEVKGCALDCIRNL